MNAISAPHPVIFEEFFELGLEESVSPFLTRDSRSWGANLTFKSSLLAAILLTLSFGISFIPFLAPLSHFLLILVYFFVGIPSLIESIEDLICFDVNIDVLMTLAAFSSILIGSGMEGGLLLVLFALSGSMEDVVESKAKGAISSLHKLSPTKACVISSDGMLMDKALADISKGTNILVKAGQIVPLDGIVIQGISTVNLVHLTGENLPVTKKLGDQVPAGGRNMEGALVLTVTHTSSDSTLARIIQLVTEAQEARPLLQRWFDRLSRSYAATIIMLSALFTLTLPFVSNIPFLGVEGSLYRALAFLIAASPCALIIAIPIAYLSAISVCARQGILLKGGITLDALAGCSSIAFDKTGTLTTGDLLCAGVEDLAGSTPLNLALVLSVASAMERNAVHPIAKSILKYADAYRIKPARVTGFKSLPGYGLEGETLIEDESTTVFIGNAAYITSKISPETEKQLALRVAEIQEKGELIAVMLIGDDIYIFRFVDTLRPHIKNTIQELKTAWRLRLVMLTGDHYSTARRVAQEAHIDEYYADLRPEDKLAHIASLDREGGVVMIGDGINDAPALARATVGICMGKVGSTPAIDAADIVLLHDNIELVHWLIGKARQTQRIVRQNVTLASAAIICAAIPALSGLIPLWLAVVLHEGGTILVGLNALRILRK